MLLVNEVLFFSDIYLVMLNVKKLFNKLLKQAVDKVYFQLLSVNLIR